MKQRPTILDVAKQAGVSKSTVSLVLQGNPAVKEETRKAVRQAMADIGYVYNRSAATLRSATSGLIGLVINDLRNPFFTEFAASFQMALSEAGFATVLANANEDPALQRRMISSLVEHGVAGFIISPSYGEEAETLALLAGSGTPTLQVFRTLEAEGASLPVLAPDYLHGGRLAAEHLIAQGCRRIAFLGGLNDRPVTRERMKGYLAVLEEQGRTPLVLTGQSTRAFGKAMAARLHEQHPDVDGVICFNDLVALGVLSACPGLGIRPGTDLRVIGFDDIEDSQDSVPPLSTISCNIPDFATETARQIVGWIREGTLPPARALSPVRLIVRASSGGA